jgi:nucleoside-diphosphate-sugar epimerase
MVADKKKVILITGATGFIGKYIVEHAIKNNYEVFIAIRGTSNTARINHLRFKTILVDFSSEESIYKSFPKTICFDAVVHNAGVTSCFLKEDYHKYNVELTKNLCAVLVKQSMLKGKFIFTSSLAALGPGTNNLEEDITELKSPRPISSYGSSKLLAEKEVMSSGVNYTIIRPTAVFGEGTLDYKDLISIVKKGLAVYTASPKQQLSFIHANDIGKAIFLILDSSGKRQVFNLSDGQQYTLASLYQTVASSLNKEIRFTFRIPLIVVFGVANFNHYLEKYFKIQNALNSIEKAKEVTALNWRCSAQKIRTELGFKASHSLKEII